MGATDLIKAESSFDKAITLLTPQKCHRSYLFVVTALFAVIHAYAIKLSYLVSKYPLNLTHVV